MIFLTEGDSASASIVASRDPMTQAVFSLRGKPLNEQVQEYALRVGLVFLLGIMFLATWNDLVQLKVVDYVRKLLT